MIAVCYPLKMVSKTCGDDGTAMEMIDREIADPERFQELWQESASII